MVNELLNSEGVWITLPVDSPYSQYPRPCTVPLNSTHLLLSGGNTGGNDYLADTWILDLENLACTPSTPMLLPRSDHGCVLTTEGEVLIAGGLGDQTNYEYSAHIFNPVTLEWRENGDIPTEATHGEGPRLLLWNSKVLMVKKYSDLIWEMTADGGWQVMDVTLGPATFTGGWENGIIVPDSWRNGC